MAMIAFGRCVCIDPVNGFLPSLPGRSYMNHFEFDSICLRAKTTGRLRSFAKCPSGCVNSTRMARKKRTGTPFASRGLPAFKPSSRQCGANLEEAQKRGHGLRKGKWLKVACELPGPGCDADKGDGPRDDEDN